MNSNYIKPLIKKLVTFAKDRLKFKHPPRLFLRSDLENGNNSLGKTAFYNPGEKSITLYTTNRHPKDILRSFAHELVHHCQNERGDLRPDKMKTMNKNYAQECPHMRKMEEEAYLQGNMCFRDWEDGLDNKLQYKMQIAEQEFLKENKNMSVKISKKVLKGLIGKLLSEQEQEINFTKGMTIKPEGAKSNLPPAVLAAIEELKQALQAPELSAKVKSAIESLSASPTSLPENAAANALKKAVKHQARVSSDLEKLSEVEEELEEGSCSTSAGSREDSVKKKKSLEEGEPTKLFARGESGCCDQCPGKDSPHLGDKPVEEGAKPMGPGPDGVNGTDDDLPAYLDQGSENEESEKKKPEKKKSEKKKSGTFKPEKGVQPEQFKKESKIRTPEQENTLYESRFTKKNTRLFEKLLKEWTK